VARLTLLIALAWWGATAWLARDIRPAAIAWTDRLFTAGLLVTYVALWAIARDRAVRRREMLFHAIGVTLVLTVLLVILEIPAALGLLDYRIMARAALDEPYEPRVNFVNDRDLGFRRPAKISWSGRPRSDMAQTFNQPVRAPRRLAFTTDARGFRNTRDVARADVVLLGDSYIEGDYVSDEDTVASALERLTRRPVANLGVSGYGTLQELRVLERHGLALEPRFVAWFFFEGNDLYNDQEFENALPYYRGLDEAPPLRPSQARSGTWAAFVGASFTRNALDVLRAWAHPLVPRSVPTSGWFRDATGRDHRMLFYSGYARLTYGEYERARFEITKSAFLKGAALASARGARPALFFIPMKFRVYGDLCRYPPHSPCPEWRPWNLAETFMAFCREEGLDCHDLTVPMRRAAASGALLYAPEDSHWTPAGHELVAREVQTVWTEPPALADGR
jgi:hypothetical protein